MAKRKRKPRKMISLPGAEPAVQRPTGRDRTHTNQPGEDARKVALQARVRIAGQEDTSDARRDCADPMAGSGMGLCIRHVAGADAARLWDTWQALCAARRAYRIRILGTTGLPQGAAIGMMPEPMQTDQGHTIDIRTAEERDAAARSADAYWSRLVAALPSPQHRWALGPAMDEVEGALWRDCAPTPRGRMAVAALVLLAEMNGGR